MKVKFELDGAEIEGTVLEEENDAVLVHYFAGNNAQDGGLVWLDKGDYTESA